MQRKLTRRNVLGAAGTLALAGSPALAAAQEANKGQKAKSLTILGISCSPRKGMTTATAMKAALDAGKEVDSRIKVELIDLGGLEISGSNPTGGKQGSDDFDSILVGAFRNGGQELVIEQIQAALLCHEVMIVGGKPGAHQGATLWNFANDDITKDEFGIDTARKLGVRVAEAATHLAVKQA
jgi:multimeric flavodoxin WrbA